MSIEVLAENEKTGLKTARVINARGEAIICHITRGGYMFHIRAFPPEALAPCGSYAENQRGEKYEPQNRS